LIRRHPRRPHPHFLTESENAAILAERAADQPRSCGIFHYPVEKLWE